MRKRTLPRRLSLHGGLIESRRRQQLAELEALYAHLPLGLCLVDSDLRFVRANERLAEMNGVSIAGHLGRTVRSVLPNLAVNWNPFCRAYWTPANPYCTERFTVQHPRKGELSATGSPTISLWKRVARSWLCTQWLWK